MRRRVLIHGRVQGVFFRASTRDQAHRLGLSGWVTNRRDGTVEAVFEGAPDAVDALLAWCREGPPGARVDHLEVTEERPEGLRAFEVR